MPSSLTARSRKSSFANPAASSGPSGHVPTSFFLASEQQMEDAVSRQSTQSRGADQAGSSKSEKPAQGGVVSEKVQSIEDALTAAFGPGGDTIRARPLSRSESVKSESSDAVGDAAKKRKRKGAEEAVTMGEASTLSGAETPRHGDSTTHSSPQPLHKLIAGHARRFSGGTASNPLTPINVDSPAYQLDSGIPSTPKSVSLRSLRLSDDGEHDDLLLNDAASQALASTDDEDEEPHKHHPADSVAPELVMPSIAMPSRRPFTDRGKRLGRLKILVAGRTNTGKTGLIRSIVQVCEDIVHVDPVPVPLYGVSDSSSAVNSKQRRPVDQSESRTAMSQTSPLAKHASEIFVSTRAYPSWWSNMEESKALLRRKSMGLGDTILERNVSFVDTPGYDADEDSEEQIVRYIESLMARSINTSSMSQSDLLHMLSGGGGAQVDVVLFLFSNDASDADLHFCKRLSGLTNVVPLFGRADLLDGTAIQQRKTEVLQQLLANGIKPFTFGRTVKALLASADQVDPKSEVSVTQASPTTDDVAGGDGAGTRASAEHLQSMFTPFAVSSAPGPDHDTMDASLLMSSDYCPPPVPSELHDLMQLLFDPEHAAWLRHASARKIIKWQRTQSHRNSESALRPGHAASPWKLGLGTPSTTSLARRSGLSSTQMPAPERAPVPKWVASLQQALRHERARDGLFDLSDGLDRNNSRAAKGRKIKRHWSEASATSSRQALQAQSSHRPDLIERVSSVTWSALRIVSIVSAVGVTACVVARRCFGIESVTIGWDWS